MIPLLLGSVSLVVLAFTLPLLVWGAYRLYCILQAGITKLVKGVR